MDHTRVPTLPRVGVGIIVFRHHNGRQQVLLHKRNHVSSGSGYWGSGGGFLELGESLLEGALRELGEEAGSGLKVNNVTFLGVCNFTDFLPEHSVDISFRADWVSGRPISDKAKESVLWQWFDLDALPSPLFPVVERYLGTVLGQVAFLDSESTSGPST
jgi:ADP-ribose pyrophosphatase YjhB (NUDIX family)